MNEAADIRQRLETIQNRINLACERSQRSPAEVTLVGVSKGQPLSRLEAAWSAGLRVFGENRVQEALGKQPHMPEGADWHLIGPLQTNKVKRALDVFQTFHAVDRMKLARALERESAVRGIRPRCFLEVNLGGEASKHGFGADDVLPLLPELRQLPHLRFVGLMAIPPRATGPTSEERQEEARRWFRTLRQLRDGVLGLWRDFPGLLSMGMSGDFEMAIEEGATHVRVGTALFGPRPGYPPQS